MKKPVKYIIWIIPIASAFYYVWFSKLMFQIQPVDGRIYLEVAQNLAEGKGFYYLSDGKIVPYTFWPPFFPMLIALIQKLFALDVIQASYLLRFVLLLYSYFMLYKILKAFRLSPLFIVTGMLVYWFSWTFFLNLVSLSESLFIPLILSSAYYIYRWTEIKFTRYLIFSGIFLGFALLTRYAGLGIWLGHLLLVFIFSKSAKNAIINAFYLTIPVIILFLPWYIYTKQFSDFFERGWSQHIIGTEHLYQFQVTLANWLVPGFTVYLIFPFTALAFISILLVWKKAFEILQDKRLLIPVFFSIVFMFFILISISFIDYDTPLDYRILSPVYIYLLLAGMFVLSEIKKLNFKLFLFLWLVIVGSHLVNIFEKTSDFVSEIERMEKLTYSDFIKNVLKNQNRVIWSNVTDLLKDYTVNDTFVYEFPVKYDRKSLKENLLFENQMKEMKKKLDSQKGMIIYFFGFEERNFLPSLNDLNEYFDDYPVMRFDEGLIIFHSAYRDSLQLAEQK